MMWTMEKGNDEHQDFSITTCIWAWADGDWEFEDSNFPNLFNCKPNAAYKLSVPIAAQHDDIDAFVNIWSANLHSNDSFDASEYWVGWFLRFRVNH